MAANRRKTIEYVVGARTTLLATNTTLGTATRYDTSSMTLYIPEATSRNFLSVRMVVTYDTVFAATNTVTGWRLGIQLGAAATSDTDRTGLAQSTANKDVHDVVDLDVTDYFNTNFGAGTSQTCVASFAASTGTAANVTNVQIKFIITYEFDSTGQTTRIKTIRIPLQSYTGFISTSQVEFGTDGTNPVSSGQIPALDTFLPEASKVYRQIFLESYAIIFTTSVAMTTFIQLDATTEVARAPLGATLATPMPFSDTYDITAALSGATNATHTVKVRSDTVNRTGAYGATLTVTYEYNSSTTTSVMCEAMVPITAADSDQMGQYIGEGFNASDGVLFGTAALNIQESSPALVQSGVYWQFHSNNTQTAVAAKAGSGTARGTTPGVSGSAVMGEQWVVHRVDHGAQWSLARGDNHLTFQWTMGATTYRNNVAAAYAVINYTATAPTDPDTATHICNYYVVTYGTTATQGADLVTTSQRAPVFGTPYRLSSKVCFDGYARSQQNIATSLLQIALGAGEYDGAGGWIQLPQWTPQGVTQYMSCRVFRGCGSYNLDNLHTGKLSPTTTHRIGWTTGNSTSLVSLSLWFTYHQISFTVSGTVTVGGSPAVDGKTIKIFAYDSNNNADLVTTTTTLSGSFSVTVTDNTRSYFAVYEDGTVVGRSALATPS